VKAVNTKYVRLYSDAGGESHFEDLEVELSAVEFAPPAPPLNLSTFMLASQAAFFGAPAGWRGDWHPSPARNLFVILSGEWEVEVSDGTVRRFGPNHVLLLEDTTGKGHASRVVSDTASIAVVVQLQE
jgi:hypothetical protein